MGDKETLDPQVLEALTEYVSEQGWDKRFPRMLLGWAKQEGIKFECGENTFRLEIESEDGRITWVSLLHPGHILINREGLGRKFKIKGHPVYQILAVNPDYIERDVEPGLGIIMENATVVVKKSGRIKGNLSEFKYDSGEE